MKKIIIFFSALVLVSLLLAQCIKKKTMYDAHFWTSMDTSIVQLSLFIDDVYKGELPYLKNPPACGGEGALSFPFESGRHKIVAKDRNGAIRSSGTLKIKSNSNRSSMSSSGGNGGQDIVSDGDCLIVKLYY